MNDWIHQHTNWKTFKHSCGAVEEFIPHFVDAGFCIVLVWMVTRFVPETKVRSLEEIERDWVRCRARLGPLNWHIEAKR